MDVAAAHKLDALNLDGLYSRKETEAILSERFAGGARTRLCGADEIGLSGVEQYYNDKIRGESGKVYLERDARRRAFESYEIQPHPARRWS